MSVNKAQLLGRLGADPELKQTSNGRQVCTFTLATSEKWKDANGDHKENTQWHRIVVYGKFGEICARHLSKGSQIFCEGKINYRNFEKEDGQKAYVTEIISNEIKFLSGSSDYKNNNDDIPF